MNFDKFNGKLDFIDVETILLLFIKCRVKNLQLLVKLA